jgi:hypothetical protein
MNDNKIKDINALLTAFESRNELLNEEIKQNEEAIKEMKKELSLILEDEEEHKLKMVG